MEPPIDPLLQILESQPVPRLRPMQAASKISSGATMTFTQLEENTEAVGLGPGASKRVQWGRDDIELLLEWFACDIRNMELYKTKAKDALVRISREVFNGRRTPNSIKSKWDGMKDKHRDARIRLESTGEGEFNLNET